MNFFLGCSYLKIYCFFFFRSLRFNQFAWSSAHSWVTYSLQLRQDLLCTLPNAFEFWDLLGTTPGSVWVLDTVTSYYFLWFFSCSFLTCICLSVFSWTLKEFLYRFSSISLCVVLSSLGLCPVDFGCFGLPRLSALGPTSLCWSLETLLLQ